MTNIAQRTITGTVFVAVIIAAILFGEKTLATLTIIVSFLSLNEFNGLVKSKYNVNIPLVESCLGAVMMTASIVLPLKYGLTLLFFIVPYYFVCMAIELFRKQQDPVKTWAFFLLGQLYIAVPFALLNLIALSDKFIVLAIFVLIWVNDTFAYLTGMGTSKTIGNHKMFPRVSPKKSWEGLAGGAVMAVVASVIFSRLADIAGFSTAVWIGLAIVIVVFGTIGDLCESIFKRTLGVKDSGTILPGHGGMLDRFDSVLFATIGTIMYLGIITTI
ncbi:MAG: phosphatidate cytidylyltransferase [Bacteroidales bacterium]|jgi:phosphatidate cytidylyltransferase|nr:phosphatidate cytidylyltransferase [Bacteroidales bacterium]